MSELLEKEARVEKALREGDKQSAVPDLYDLIVAYAKQKNFAKAEALRDRLFEADPMALSEIVESAEIIEREKSESRDEVHMKAFAPLYASLSAEEANAFYFALNSVLFEADHPVLKEGERNTRLYLIDQGEVKLTHGEEEQEVSLKTLAAGAMFGAETFFSRTAFSTFSACTITAVRAMALDNSALKTWRDAFPGLEGKLAGHCFRSGGTQELLDRKALHRRNQDRIHISGTVGLQLLGKDGKPMGKPFKGGFIDISKGGVAFSVRMSKPETARVLLGRRILMTCHLPLRGGMKGLRTSGRIIGIEPLPFNEYSIRVRFDKELPQKLLDNLDLSSSARSPDLDLKIE